MDFLTAYYDHLYTMVDTGLIAKAGLRVVYDPLYGSASRHFADLMRAMGVNVSEIHAKIDGETDRFHPEPIEPWVDECERTVVAQRASAGLVNDGDGDRVGAVDESGRFVSPQMIVAVVIEHLCRHRNKGGRIVLSQSSAIVPRRLAKDLGYGLSIKPVGFNHIYSEMKKGGVLLGAGEAGGIGIPEHMPERDGLLTNLLLCEAMAASGKSLAQLIEELEKGYGRYYYASRDVRAESEVIEAFRTILPGLNPSMVAGRVPVGVSHMDGLRLEFSDESWLLLRPSGTVPVVRVYAEAQTVELRDELIDAGCDLIESGIPVN